jgi:F-type H+-transporting ATPase subunit O
MTEQKVKKICQGILSYLKKTGNLNLLPEIIRQLRLTQKSLNKTVEVISAIPLEPEEKENLEKNIQKIFGRPLKIENKVNPSILGGLKIKFQDKVIDASLLASLQDLEAKIAQK